MVKKFAIFLIGLIAMINLSTAQVTVKISDETVAVGGTVDVDVTLDNFTDIILFSYSINWDETVVKFNSIVNVSTTLPQFSEAANFGTPDKTGGEPGELALSWSKTNTQPESLPSNTLLFSIRFDVIGAACESSNVRLSNSPTVIEFVDSNTNNVNAIASNGEVVVDCDGGGGDLVISSPDLSGDAGTNICVPINVTNFIDVLAATLEIEFDPSILVYTNVQNVDLFGFDAAGNFGVSNADQGELILSWFDSTVENPATVEGTLMEVCFDIIGSAGQISAIELLNGDFSNSNDESLVYTAENGTVSVSGNTGGSDDFTVVSGDSSIPMGDVGCVPISVKNFNDIQSMQFAISWDASLLAYDNIENLNLTQLKASNFNQTADDKLRLTWNNLTGGTSVPDDQVIFDVCFQGIGACDEGTSIMFTNDPPISIEVSNGSNEVVPVNFEVGTATVECGCSISVREMVNPTCNGDADGSILVSVGGGGVTYTCTWTDASGAVVQSSSDCDLVDVAAGTYTLAISDGADCAESQSFTLEAPAAIVFGGSKLDETENCDGSINLSMIGGTAPFTFAWGDGPTTNARPNLCAGEYCVTATDSNGCAENTCFTVQPVGLSVVADITDVRCFGDDNGGIDISILGGVETYVFTWSGPSGTFTTEDINNLSAGNYSVTITDGSIPALEFVGNYQVTQPDEILIGASVKPSDGANGSIDITVTGGQGPYSYVWTPNGENTEDLNNLAPGDYRVLVTDDNNCNVTSQIFTIFSTFINIDITSSNSVSCFGVCDGTIDGAITGGSQVYTFKLDGNVVEFPVTGLCPGSYVFSVEDDQGVFASDDVIIGEPTELILAFVLQSDCVAKQDGFIEVTASGGTGSYDFNWSNSGTGSRVENLDDGTYGVLVSDENNCQVAMESIILESCDPPVPCFTARPVITPNNGDNFNNEFFIACADDFETHLNIYDRWGQTVFSMANYDNSWAGQDDRGNELPEGAYFWILEVTNADGIKELQKGNVTILRDQF